MNSESFKAGDLGYRAIILPFQSRWRDPIMEGKVKAVFRKKGPAPKAAPQWMYAYIGAPVSAICARFEIAKVEQVTCSQASERCADGMLSEVELHKYAGKADSLYVFQIGKCSLPKHPLGMDELFQRFGFRTTPSFVALSDDGWRDLDRALGFGVDG